jgi:hypothetical protein
LDDYLSLIEYVGSTNDRESNTKQTTAMATCTNSCYLSSRR